MFRAKYLILEVAKIYSHIAQSEANGRIERFHPDLADKKKDYSDNR